MSWEQLMDIAKENRKDFERERDDADFIKARIEEDRGWGDFIIIDE